MINHIIRINHIGYPFFLNDTTEYTNNIKYKNIQGEEVTPTNFIPGDECAIIELTIDKLTPLTLYYQEAGHTGENIPLGINTQYMGGIIHIGGTSGAPPLSIRNGSTSGGFIDLYEQGPNEINKIRLECPSVVNADYTLTLPDSSGTKDEILIKDGKR